MRQKRGRVGKEDMTKVRKKVRKWEAACWRSGPCGRRSRTGGLGIIKALGLHHTETRIRAAPAWAPRYGEDGLEPPKDSPKDFYKTVAYSQGPGSCFPSPRLSASHHVDPDLKPSSFFNSLQNLLAQSSVRGADFPTGVEDAENGITST